MSDEVMDDSPLGREISLLSQRIREKYDLDSVLILTCKQSNECDRYDTRTEYALSGNHYAAKHLARRYSDSFGG